MKPINPARRWVCEMPQWHERSYGSTRKEAVARMLKQWGLSDPKSLVGTGMKVRDREKEKRKPSRSRVSGRGARGEKEGEAMTDPLPLTSEERGTLAETLRLGSWRYVQNPEEIVARYEAQVCALESEIVRLRAVACEWEPVSPREVGMKIIAQDTFSLGGRCGSRTVAGRLAATLAHFARTGELPKPESFKE